MNTPNNKRKKASQEKIEKTFLQLIQTKELEDISITDICKIAKLNRSTFYANYIDIFDLVSKIKDRMINEYVSMYENDSNASNNPNSYLKMFKHIKNNQTFYRTYFKLKFDMEYEISYSDKELSKQFYNNKYIDYHCEFFKAGITAIIKMWLNNNCKETPEEMVEILTSEYNSKD